MRLLRGLFLVAIALACTPTVQRFSDTITPAFLGDASGIYQVISSDGVPIPFGNRFLAIEIRGQLVVAGQVDGTTFSFVGALSADAGGRVAKGAVTLLGASPDDSGTLVPFADSVTAELSVGIDSLTLRGHDSPKSPEPCFATSVGCGFALAKLCDFDPKIAGIFEMKVTATNDNGKCASHDSLAGARQWAVATINSSSTSLVVSVTDAGLEFGSLLSLDLQSRALATVLSLPLTSDVSVDPVIAFTGNLTLTTDQVEVSAKLLTRTFPDGCVQNYTATGDRQQGVTFSTACPIDAAFQCFNDFSTCPPVAAGFTGAVFSLSADGAIGATACPQQSCVTEFAASSLCNDSETRRAAAGGCALALPPQSVATSAVPGPSNCMALTCVANPDCGKIDSDSIPVTTDYCANTPDNLVALSYTNNTTCVVATCRNLNPGCPTAVSCCDYSGETLGRFDQDNGCFEQGCNLIAESNNPNALPLADLTQLDVASKHLLLSGDYSIGGVDARGLPIVLQVSNGSSSSGPTLSSCGSPVDVDQPDFYCPADGTIDPSNESCVSPGNPTAVKQSASLFYYRQTSGSGGAICLGYYSADKGLLRANQGSDCSGKTVCCLGASSQDELPLGCGTPYNPATEISMVVSVYNGSATIAGPQIDQGGNANTQVCNGGPGATLVANLPLLALQSGYPLTLVQSGTCYFDTGTGYGCANLPALGSGCYAIALDPSDAQGSTVTIIVKCP